jgi:hypothetical protein
VVEITGQTEAVGASLNLTRPVAFATPTVRVDSTSVGRETDLP